VHLLVLGHVSFIGEIVKVAGVCLRVELGDKGGSLSTQRGPIDLGKVLMRVDGLNRRETLGFGGDETGSMRLVCERRDAEEDKHTWR
jgi:hypothetical protein